MRLSKDIGSGADTEVEIVRHGDTVTIRRRKQRSAQMVENLRKLPKSPV